MRKNILEWNTEDDDAGDDVDYKYVIATLGELWFSGTQENMFKRADMNLYKITCTKIL